MVIDGIEGLCEVQVDQLDHVSFVHQTGYTVFLKEIGRARLARRIGHMIALCQSWGTSALWRDLFNRADSVSARICYIKGWSWSGPGPLAVSNAESALGTAATARGLANRTIEKTFFYCKIVNIWDGFSYQGKNMDARCVHFLFASVWWLCSLSLHATVFIVFGMQTA